MQYRLFIPRASTPRKLLWLYEEKRSNGTENVNNMRRTHCGFAFLLLSILILVTKSNIWCVYVMCDCVVVFCFVLVFHLVSLLCWLPCVSGWLGFVLLTNSIKTVAIEFDTHWCREVSNRNHINLCSYQWNFCECHRASYQSVVRHKQTISVIQY